MNNDKETLSYQSDVGRTWRAALRVGAVVVAQAAAVIAIIYWLGFRWIHPEFAAFMDREATPQVAFGKEFSPISTGGHRIEGNQAVIQGFNVDEAILALPLSYQAEDYPFIKVNVEGVSRFSRVKILWRQSEDLSEVHALELNRSGQEVTQIAMVYGHDKYRGRIADIALLFYDGPAIGSTNNGDLNIILKSIELRPFSALGVVEQIIEDWTNPPLWRGSSNNYVRGIHANGLIFPNAVANLLIVVGLTLLWARTVSTPHSQNCGAHSHAKLLATALCVFMYAWAFSDVFRWHWRVEQLLDSHERYSGKSLEQRVANNDIRCARFPETCASHLLPYF